jgi:hypothetical protein
MPFEKRRHDLRMGVCGLHLISAVWWSGTDRIAAAACRLAMSFQNRDGLRGIRFFHIVAGVIPKGEII